MGKKNIFLFAPMFLRSFGWLLDHAEIQGLQLNEYKCQDCPSGPKMFFKAPDYNKHRTNKHQKSNLVGVPSCEVVVRVNWLLWFFFFFFFLCRLLFFLCTYFRVMYGRDVHVHNGHYYVQMILLSISVKTVHTHHERIICQTVVTHLIPPVVIAATQMIVVVDCCAVTLRLGCFF